MTLLRFVTKNAFRNKRRSILTVASIAFSLLLLTFMMTLWHAFSLDEGSSESAQRLVVRHRGSLALNMPSYYREKIRDIPGVVAVVPLTWFQGVYKDQKAGNYFARFATDPYELLNVYRDMPISDDQVKAWQRDRQGAIVDDTLATNYGWKLGDRIFLQGDIYPVNLELKVRGIFHSNPDNKSVYFHSEYLEESFPLFKGQTETFGILVDSPAHVSKVAVSVDEMFHNAPQPTKTETDKAFMLEFVTMMGNVKAFILMICLAVFFATLLVSANTIAISIRERTREVAVLEALGFTRIRILILFVSEAVGLSVTGGLIGACLGELLVYSFGRAVQLTFFPLRMTFGVWGLALLTSGMVGLLSAAWPSYHASRVNIVDGLRHIG
jgi:putative ABC transport system permease protein